jgi:Biotin-lipoyl like
LGKIGVVPNNSLGLARVDHVLNELDRLARTDLSPRKFYADLLSQLKTLLDVVGCSIVVPVHSSRWCAISATTAAFADESECQLAGAPFDIPAREITPWLELAVTLVPKECETNKARWLGRSLNGVNWSSGGILVKLAGPITAEMKDLMTAMADTAGGFSMRHELAQAESRSNEIRAVIGSMMVCNGERNADRLLVDGARSLMDADRVSLVQLGIAGAKNKIIAISGQPQLEPKANFNTALMQLLSNSKGDTSNQQLDVFAKENGAAVAIFFPLAKGPGHTQSPFPGAPNSALLLEWFDRERYAQNASHVSSSLTWVSHAWHELPRAKTPVLWKSRLVHWTIAVAFMAGAVLFFLSSAELTILAQGTLEPAEQRFLFAPTDGYVDKIHIADGQRVVAGEIIVSLSSPQLQLQINQVSAEIGIVDQKRDGLNLAINQLKSAEDPANLTGSRLVGEVQELEAKRRSLVEQKKLLDREQERLTLRSPINGNVIAWEVDKFLENRPVRRGDTLFRIAALDQNWRIEATVVDWEAGYVTDAYQKYNDLNKPLAVEFVVSSSAGETHVGHVSQMGDSMRDVLGSQRLDLEVSPKKPIQRPRLGTSATVSIPCGQFPRWFVWTRSIIDAVRRRFWL